MLLKVRGKLIIRADKLANTRQLEQTFSQLGNVIMQITYLLAALLHFYSRLLRLLLCDRLIGQVAKSSIAIKCCCASRLLPARLLHHQAAYLLLQAVVLFSQLVVLFLDAQMVLDLLCLIAMSD